jgi:hypothetical protein
MFKRLNQAKAFISGSWMDTRRIEFHTYCRLSSNNGGYGYV